MSPSAKSAIERGLVGPAGEHFVLFRLYQQGMLASLSPPGLAMVDILVMAYDQSVVATLQAGGHRFDPGTLHSPIFQG